MIMKPILFMHKYNCEELSTSKDWQINKKTLRCVSFS